MPERLRHFSRIGKDKPGTLIAAPLWEAADEIDQLRRIIVFALDYLGHNDVRGAQDVLRAANATYPKQST